MTTIKVHTKMKNKIFSNNKVIGSHFIIDLFGCNRQEINSAAFLKKTLTSSLEGTDIVVLDSGFYTFEKQGVTGFLLLSTSHLSVHSWPEYDYLSVDLYSCSSEKMTRRALDYLLEKFTHREAVVRAIERTYDVMPEPGHDDPILQLPSYKSDPSRSVHIRKRVENIKSWLQRIEIIDTEEFGLCMLIDKKIQTSETDHHLYDEAMLAGLSNTDREIIILGGGDGYVAEAALKINPSLKITIVDLDPEVVAVAKRHLGQKVFDHPNVTTYIGDALSYLQRRQGEPVDGVLADLTDNPISHLKDPYGDDHAGFYGRLMPLIKRHLHKDGWLMFRASAPEMSQRHINTGAIIEGQARQHFDNVTYNDVFIPSFGEKNRFIMAR